MSGVYDFKKEVIDYLEVFGEKQYVNQSKHAKKRGNYYFRIVNEITKCRYKGLDIFEDETFISELLTINDHLILRTQKIQVFDVDLDGGQGSLVELFDTREDFMTWVRLNMDKKSWKQLHNSFGVEGKDLYVTSLILTKRAYNFENQTNYYVTATPGVLETLGYKLDTSMQYQKTSANKIEKFDIFVLQNKSKTISDINEFVLLLREYKELETFIVVDKEKTMLNYVKNKKKNTKYNHINFVKDGHNCDSGREASNPKRNNGHITIVYQKSSETQGTNYKAHSFMIQDCHGKISVIERIVPDKGGLGLIITPYGQATYKQYIQSIGRVCRGSLKYKSVVLFADFLENEEEREIISAIGEEMSKYGFDVNLEFIEKDITRKKDKQLVFNSILRHVYGRHQMLNLGSSLIPYSFDLNNLSGKIDKRKKVVHSDSIIFSFYLETKYNLQKEHDRKIKDTEIVSLLEDELGISCRKFKMIKKKFTELLEDEITTNILVEYTKLLHWYRKYLAGLDEYADISEVVLNDDKEVEAARLAIDELMKTGNKKDTTFDDDKVSK